MKFRYVGEEYTEWFGFKWMAGTVHDVTDEHAIGKLSNSVLFEKVGPSDPATEAPKRRARQPRENPEG
jgi:hypothetical protein